ncbi:MAG TPA: ATP-binding protein [Paraburkholderia sp.]|nr:ATP-binding protein [Paraburkholderia sp.]
MRDSALSGLVLSNAHAEPMGDLRFAFPLNRLALRDRVNHGLREIGDEERTRLLSQWISMSFSPPSPTESFVLSESERAFLANLPPVKVALTMQWSPFSYLDKTGQPSGILPDYISYLEKTLNIRIERESQRSPADEKKLLATGAADLIAYVAPVQMGATPPGATEPILTYPVVVVAHRTDATVSHISQLAQRRVAVVEREGTAALVRAAAPSATVIRTTSIKDAMRLVRDDEADAFVANLAAVDQLLQSDYTGDLRVIGYAGYQQAIGFELRPAFQRLIPIINRALSAMPEDQRLAIQNRYLATSYQLGMSWQDVAREAAPFIVVVSLAIAILAFGYARLRAEVRRRQQTERELQTLLKFRTTLLDMVPFPIGVRDNQGLYIDVNSQAEHVIGIPRSKIIGSTLDECAAMAGDAGSLTPTIQATMQRHHIYEGVRLDYHDADGALRHGLYWHRSFLDDQGAVAGTIGVVVDVTSAFIAERKVRETEALLRGVTQNLPAAVFQLRRDAAGAHSYQYLGGNLALAPSIPIEGLMLDADLATLAIADADARRLIAAIDASARTMSPFVEDFEVRDTTTSRWLRINAVPHSEEDDALVWDGYWDDITREHRRATELEEARDMAEHASAAKDQFLAMMSHEIRTPMSGVLGLVEVLAQGDLHGEQVAIVGMIHDSAGALLQILDDILDYSKIQAAKLAIANEPFDLREVCDLAMGLLSARAHEKGLALRCRVASRVAALHRGDSVRLRQVLLNLLGNSTKFTSTGSVSLHVDVEREMGNVQMLCMKVTDTGIGVQEKHIRKLFSPFVQGDSSTSRRFGGTGLGLTISSHLMKLMGGSLELTSKPGAGTCVAIRMPLPVERRRNDDPRLSHLHAFVHVSNNEVASAIADGLTALGVRSAIVGDAAQLAALRGQRAEDAPNVVFLDTGESLPDMSPPVATIHITDRPKAAGYRLTENDIRVSINPLSTRGLRAVCDAVTNGGGAEDAERPSPQHAPHPSLSRADAIRAGALILVAEDNPINRHLIERQLELLGCACDVVDDGEQALKACETTHYAILITDCHMPIVNGYALARAIRERAHRQNQAAEARLPIIGVTASIELGERERCLEAGMDACLRKPTQLEVLRACLERWAPACLPVTATGIDAERVDRKNGALRPTAQTQNASESLPSLDWIAICGNQSSAGRDEKLVKVIADSLQADASALPTLVAAEDVTALREWIHRLDGVASFLHYAPLADAMAEFRLAVVGKNGVTVAEAASALSEKLHRITLHLARQ